MTEEKPQYKSNFNLTDIVTPVHADKFKNVLEESGYDPNKTDYLYTGFKEGFDLGYKGKEDVRMSSPNLKFVIGSKTILWNKVMSKVEAGRYAGPFENIPFDSYIQSPIGLVPKDGGKKTRLIFHLSFPRNTEDSVNANIPKDLCTVKYQSIDDAIRICNKLLEEASHKNSAGILAGAKSDLTSAFRHIPIKRKFWRFLVMKAQHPKTGKFYYFVDKCMPFGASISCVIFQKISDAISLLVNITQIKRTSIIWRISCFWHWVKFYATTK